MDSQAIFESLLRQGHPVAVSFVEGSRLLGFNTTGAGYTAYNRQKYPVTVRKIGSRLSIALSDIASYLANEATSNPATLVDAPRRGRPTKAMSITRSEITKGAKS